VRIAILSFIFLFIEECVRFEATLGLGNYTVIQALGSLSHFVKAVKE
jgi:hypothetical protein